MGFRNGDKGCPQRQSRPRADLRSQCAWGSLAGGPTSTQSCRTVQHDTLGHVTRKRKQSQSAALKIPRAPARRRAPCAREPRAVTAGVALFEESHAEYPELSVLPTQQHVGLGVGLCRQVGIDAAEQRRSRQALFEVERFRRLRIDGACHASLDHVGRLGLVNDRARDHFRGQQVIAHAAPGGRGLIGDEPVAGRDGMAVDGRLRQAGRSTADTHAVVFIEPALAAGSRLGIDARDALQNIRNILVGQLTDVFGSHDLNVLSRGPFGRERAFHGIADAGDESAAPIRRLRWMPS